MSRRRSITTPRWEVVPRLEVIPRLEVVLATGNRSQGWLKSCLYQPIPAGEGRLRIEAH